MKSYSHAPDASNCIDSIQAAHHQDLEGVIVAALFVFDLEATEPVLKHQGYPAGAVVRITPVKERALGMADATIVIDRSTWVTLSGRQRDALIDHELTHLTRKLDKENGAPEFDVLDRPKLQMRRHDHQFGWFDEVAQRHGEASSEVRQARRLMESSGQLYFDFGPRAQDPSPRAAETPAPDPDEGDEEDEAKRAAAAAAAEARKRAVKRPPASRAVRNPKPRYLNA